MADSLEALLAQYPGESRAARVDAAVRAMRAVVGEARVAIAELMWEMHGERHWRLLRRGDGTPYASAYDYYVEVVGPVKPSTFHAVVQLGRAVRSVPIGSRNWLRTALAAIPWTRATMLAGAILQSRDLETIAAWVDRARRLGTSALADAIKNASGERTLPRRGPKSRWEPCPTCGRPMRRASAVGEARA